MTYCQSCGMPMSEDAHFGTEAGGAKSEDYCTYCYQNGAFTAPCTMEEMMDICLPHMVQAGMEETQAKAMMQQMFPQLKRWKQ